jgi:hypothetical protein
MSRALIACLVLGVCSYELGAASRDGITLVIVEDAKPPKFIWAEGDTAAKQAQTWPTEESPQNMAKKADYILAHDKTPEIIAQSLAAPKPRYDYQPSASDAAEQDMDKSPAGQAYYAECKALAKRQLEAAAGKALKDGSTFSARITFRHFVGECSSESDRTASDSRYRSRSPKTSSRILVRRGQCKRRAGVNGQAILSLRAIYVDDD